MIEAAVIDASVAVKWVVNEPGSDRASLLARARLEAPELLPIECANILWKKVRIGDLTRKAAAERLQLLLEAPLSITGSGALLESALQVSFELDHPVYDCLYVALALRQGLPLITADARLAGAARKRTSTAGCVLLLDEISGLGG
jgi:predicted nucleic acid-binding protein